MKIYDRRIFDQHADHIMELPSHYLITPKAEQQDAFLDTLKRSLTSGIRLLQLRDKGLDETTYEELAQQVIALAHQHDCRVLLSGDAQRVIRLGADGLHLDSKALSACQQRPLPDDYLIAASGHTLASLQHAQGIGAHFAVLSPIRFTKAHPDIEPHGWEGYGQIAAALSIPVYALGGVDAGDEQAALEAGGQGIAGHRGYWQE